MKYLIFHKYRPIFFLCLTLVIHLFITLKPVYAEETYPIVFGFSQSILGSNVNANDATAAVKTWTNSLAKSAHIPADPKPVIFDTLVAMYNALYEKQSEVFFITIPELFPVLDEMDQDTMIIPVTNGTITEQYLLLTNNSSGIASLEQLRGKDILIYSSSRTSIAPYWLGTEIRQETKDFQTNYFSQVTKVSKLNDAVLPVFFNKAASCLVSKSGFDTLAELNPQVAKNLTVIKESPEYVPSGLFFRKDYESPIKERIITDLDEWLSSSNGKQLLTIFQLESLRIENRDSLKNSLELLDKHEALLSSDDLHDLHN